MPQRMIGSKATVRLLRGIVTYRQITHWLSTGILEASGQVQGSGGSHSLDLEDVLRFRAMGLLLRDLGHGWSLRDAAAVIKAASVKDLTNSISLQEGRVQFTIDLSIQDDEPKLRDWVNQGLVPA